MNLFKENIRLISLISKVKIKIWQFHFAENHLLELKRGEGRRVDPFKKEVFRLSHWSSVLVVKKQKFFIRFVLIVVLIRD